MKYRVTNQEHNIASYRYSNITASEALGYLEQDLAEYREDLLQPFDLLLAFINDRHGTNTKLSYTVSLEDIASMLEHVLKENRGVL